VFQIRHQKTKHLRADILAMRKSGAPELAVFRQRAPPWRALRSNRLRDKLAIP
jgi:hypothetical protein